MASRVSRLLIDTIAALTVIAVGCVNQSFEVGSMDGAIAAGRSGVIGDIPGSSSGSYSQPQGGSKALTVMPDAGGANAAGPTGMLLSTTDWRATASNTFPDIDPGVVLDPNAMQTWTSGAYQALGMWFQIDMRTPQRFYQIEIDSTSMPGDAAVALSVATSLDGSFNEPAVAGDVLGSAQTVISFTEPQYAQYIRITLTQSSNRWWSIDAIRVRQ